MSVAFLQYFSAIEPITGLQFRDTFAGLLLVHASVAIPYVTTVVLARLAVFDSTLEDAAYGLGAGTFRTLCRITLPIIAPAIFSGGFFAFLLSLDNVPLSLFLVGGSLTLLPVELFSAIQFDLTRTIYALSTIVCLATTLVVLFVYRWLTSVVAIARM
jgi:putative spermidine/putrescine transport system permease protein